MQNIRDVNLQGILCEVSKQYALYSLWHPNSSCLKCTWMIENVFASFQDVAGNCSKRNVAE